MPPYTEGSARPTHYTYIQNPHERECERVSEMIDVCARDEESKKRRKEEKRKNRTIVVVGFFGTTNNKLTKASSFRFVCVRSTMKYAYFDEMMRFTVNAFGRECVRACG